MRAAVDPHVTPAPWAANLQHDLYATRDTYELAADWLRDCIDVADWGGGTGYFRQVLAPSVTYRVVDGTRQVAAQALADLRTFREPADGILIRHVLDVNHDWRQILDNALASFQRRMVVVTFTPDAAVTGVVKMKSGWPVLNFAKDDLRAAMAPHLVADVRVQTSHPEHVFYLERAR